MSSEDYVKSAKVTLLECAPVGKFSRLVHHFMLKKHLPALFSVWGIISIPIAGWLAVAFASPFLVRAHESNAGYLAALLLIPVLFLLVKMLLKPSHFKVTPEGVSYYWAGSFMISGKVLRWNEIQKISVIQPDHTSRVQSRLLRFCGPQRRMDLKLDEVTDPLTLPSFYDAILEYAPHVPRDPEVQSVLGSDQANASYTELWLKALTAPPERSRLELLSPGTSLQDGDYVVQERIGVGGQGVAYTANMHNSPSKVVLKEYVLPLGVSHGIKAESLEKFHMEAHILSQLDHPQIVRLLDFFFEDHRAYMVLDYVEGRNLRALLQSTGALPETQVVELATQMADILEYLHSRNPAIIHRDFTPDNLILTADGILKLIDFNVAQHQKISATATVVGKHSYIAPDQFRGHATPQSDIYSMGATISFLLTSTEPKPISVSHPRQKVCTISPELDEIVSRCTAIDPAGRFASATKFREALHTLSPPPRLA